MRCLLVTLALAGALFSVPAIAADGSRDDRYPVAQGANASDVTKAVRACNRNPKACKVRGQERRSRAAPALLAMIDAFAVNQGLSSALGRALVDVESGFNPGKRGREGEWGLTQIKCQTARGLGFAGSCGSLADVATNLRWGLKHARRALDRGSIGFHQSGLYARRTSARYVARVHAAMR